MRCNVCGRELKDGQMFCQCGNTVGNVGGAQLNVNRASGAKVMLIAALVGFALLAAAVIGVIALIGAGKSNITDRTKWETIDRPDYQMTIPGGMKSKDINFGMQGVEQLDTFYNRDVLINVSVVRLSEEQMKFFKRKKIVEMIKSMMPSQLEDGTPIEPQERGNMIYIEYEQDIDSAGLRSGKWHAVAGYFVSNSGIYIVSAASPQDKFEKYDEYIFAWYDSFRAKK